LQGESATDGGFAPRQTAAEDSGVELNTKARYAVMAMADLAKHGAGAAVPLSAIAERQNLSFAYLEQIFLRLRRAGLVESTRGRSGGYALTRPAGSISIAEIMDAMHEETRMTRCLDGDVPCLGDRRCLTHALWHALGGHIASFLANVTLQEVLDGIPPAKLPAAPRREKELAVS
jgi:Rrf2 family transcriptional regulator, iron-sulfur cluster assembly transcription factor